MPLVQGKPVIKRFFVSSSPNGSNSITSNAGPLLQYRDDLIEDHRSAFQNSLRGRPLKEDSVVVEDYIIKDALVHHPPKNGESERSNNNALYTPVPTLCNSVPTPNGGVQSRYHYEPPPPPPLIKSPESSVLCSVPQTTTTTEATTSWRSLLIQPTTLSIGNASKTDQQWDKRAFSETLLPQGALQCCLGDNFVGYAQSDIPSAHHNLANTSGSAELHTNFQQEAMRRRLMENTLLSCLTQSICPPQPSIDADSGAMTTELETTLDPYQMTLYDAILSQTAHYESHNNDSTYDLSKRTDDVAESHTALDDVPNFGHGTVYSHLFKPSCFTKQFQGRRLRHPSTTSPTIDANNFHIIKSEAETFDERNLQELKGRKHKYDDQISSLLPFVGSSFVRPSSLSWKRLSELSGPLGRLNSLVNNNAVDLTVHLEESLNTTKDDVHLPALTNDDQTICCLDSPPRVNKDNMRCTDDNISSAASHMKLLPPAFLNTSVESSPSDVSNQGISEKSQLTCKSTSRERFHRLWSTHQEDVGKSSIHQKMTRSKTVVRSSSAGDLNRYKKQLKKKWSSTANFLRANAADQNNLKNMDERSETIKKKEVIKQLRKSFESLGQQKGSFELDQLLKYFIKTKIAMMTYEQLIDFTKLIDHDHWIIFGILSGQHGIPKKMIKNSAIYLLLKYINPKHPNLSKTSVCK